LLTLVPPGEFLPGNYPIPGLQIVFQTIFLRINSYSWRGSLPQAFQLPLFLPVP